MLPHQANDPERNRNVFKQTKQRSLQQSFDRQTGKGLEGRGDGSHALAIISTLAKSGPRVISPHVHDLCEGRKVAEVVAPPGKPTVDGQQSRFYSQLVLVKVARALDADAEQLVAELMHHDAAEPVLCTNSLNHALRCEYRQLRTCTHACAQPRRHAGSDT